MGSHLMPKIRLILNKKKGGGGVIGSITCMNKTTGRVTRYSEHSFNAARKIVKREQNVFDFVKNCIRI